jgi:hypothetical protein
MNYDTTCENKRTMELYTDMANRPMVLIRFNCDKYVKNNIKYKGLFTLNKIDAYTIADTKEFNTRIKVLVDTIVKNTKVVPDKAITTIYLYYSDDIEDEEEQEEDNIIDDTMEKEEEEEQEEDNIIDDTMQ